MTAAIIAWGLVLGSAAFCTAAVLVRVIRLAWLGRRYAARCGSIRRAHAVLNAVNDKHTDKVIRRGMRAGVALRLIK